MGKYDVEKEKWGKKSSAKLMDKKADLKVTRQYEDFFSRRNILRPIMHFFDLKGKNATVLDFGCGCGWTTVLLAQVSRKVHAFDISHASTKVLKSIIEYNSIPNIYPYVANAESLPFKDESFDFVMGSAVLHHIDLRKSLSEINRVLKRGGKAAFCEPFGHNPLINFYRYVKHHLLEEFAGTDKPIKYSDKIIFEDYFQKVKFVETSFLRDEVACTIPLEAAILKLFPFTRRFSCYVTILLQK